MWRWFPLLPAVTFLAACVPQMQTLGPRHGEPAFEGAQLRAIDGAALPLHVWRPAGPPRAVIVALHGFNMHGGLFEEPARYWAARGIATYAYDQRGFGGGPNRGIWPEPAALVADLRTAVALAARAHPGVPVHVLGDSMGGAVAILALTAPDPPPAATAILVAPAVWGRTHMGAVERGALWFFAHAMPWYPLTGQGLGVTASDNAPFLRALGRDPRIIRETRIDAVRGIVALMDRAAAAAPRLALPSLVLYGTKDEIIPADPTFEFLRAMPAGAPLRAAIYANGYHMLLHDLGAARALGDIAAWIADPAAALPSGAERVAQRQP
ncbi:MAG: alpha/beta hydrolase [Alphaproteobacteria bacterium]|nr:alpha/beta hydrolase [Alphaproteobacteria bacterium]